MLSDKSELYKNDLSAVIKNIPDAEALRGSSFLVTGATGLICSCVIDLLLMLNHEMDFGIQIYAAGRNYDGFMKRFGGETASFHYVRYDATLPVVFSSDYDYVIHGAGNAHPAAFSAEPVETMLANITGLKNLLEYAKARRCKRVLYVSSSEVYGGRNSDCEVPFKESDYGYVDLLNPRAAYPSSKRAAETLISAYHDEYGLDSVIVRPGHIYGPTQTDADSRACAQFLRNAVSGADIVMKSEGSQLRSYVYCADCASAILSVLIRGKAAEAYNISNRESVVTIRQLAEEIAAAAGVNIVFQNPRDRERKGYNMMNNSSLDAAKLEALGWTAVFNIKKGVSNSIEILRAMLAIHGRGVHTGGGMIV